jgi:hypothetical protein
MLGGQDLQQGANKTNIWSEVGLYGSFDDLLQQVRLFLVVQHCV